MLRWLLLPFSWLYGAILRLRHALYDSGILSSRSVDVPTIVVGNLALGGTGKTPHVEYLLRMLGNDVATLSRGYGRSTKGYRVVESTDSPSDVGDEPLQLKQAFSQVTVAVCEDRVEGVRRLIEGIGPELVVLDDAYQHRALKPGFSILLMRYAPDCRERLFPVGRLRDLFSRHSKADVIVVSKCPEGLSSEGREAYATRFMSERENVFFSRLSYGSPTPLFEGEARSLSGKSLILITGLADAAPMRDYCEEKATILHHFDFKDHHAYGPSDLQSLKEKFDSFDGARPIILTTSKDAVKLRPVTRSEGLSDLPIYVLPIEVEFLARMDIFEKKIRDYVG